MVFHGMDIAVWLLSSQFEAVTNKAAMNILIHVISFCGYMSSLLLGICQGIRLMSHKVDIYLPFRVTVEQFSKVVLSIHILTHYE